ncbi:hypothetical protein [Rubrimonas cliftonensis]|uniref:Uncharacterized protein n=1 Tax=Rubrimonas cliftonensis TaxID=89524 RepID=A0A1H4CG11_9RHOB|nr:hypothetical protein [Rubrimonas cliftonensis]SEA59375.1 hypothetical protein SAMN05444370_10760 [Rubrimonas cliftonensis]
MTHDRRRIVTTVAWGALCVSLTLMAGAYLFPGDVFSPSFRDVAALGMAAVASMAAAVIALGF